MPLIDLLRHKTAEEKAELERLNDEILELFGKCKRPADHRKLNKLLKRQGEILGWRENLDGKRKENYRNQWHQGRG